EPGFIFTDDLEFVYNPCFTGDMKLLTKDGYKTFEELDGSRVDVVNKDGKVSNGKVWCNGEKETIEILTWNGERIKCTPDHVFMLNDGTECKAKDTVGKRLMAYKGKLNNNKDMYVKLGFIQGDGCTGRLKSKEHSGLEVNIGERDSEIAELFGISYDNEKRIYYTKGYNETLIKLGFSSEKLPERTFPSTYSDWTIEEKKSFLRGCYSANGSVITNYRVAYKTTCKTFVEQLQKALSELGIESRTTTNKSKKVLFSNGEYQCRESYDININKLPSIAKFYELIGFVQQYKNESLETLITKKSPLVRSVKSNGLQKVYDFSEPLVHWGVVEGVVVHNCVEVGMLPVTA
ncbi:MAG: LAGLIDADG family homing endonuclease, partial [Anaerovoracaceae bacterium]